MEPTINIVTVVQARMGSSRLPNKVIMSLAGKPLLLRIFERIKLSPLAGTIVVATTTETIDDIIFQICKNNNIEVFRGDPNDLLDRHYMVGLKYDADVVVKIPSDCPLIDPSIITKVLKFYLDHQPEYDYVSNLHPSTYPDGNDIEVMTMNALKTAWLESKKNFEREHTTPFIWENPQRFKIGNITWETGYDYSMTHRWTIDYEEDYIFIKNIYDELYYINPHFSMYDILNLLEKKPSLMEINKKYNGVNWYRNHLNDLKTISPNQTRVINL
ncbi:MAG: glycosyltransferase family protein [Ignavibacterium sp.]